jgi:hypothetical protein
MKLNGHLDSGVKMEKIIELIEEVGLTPITTQADKYNHTRVIYILDGTAPIGYVKKKYSNRYELSVLMTLQSISPAVGRLIQSYGFLDKDWPSWGGVFSWKKGTREMEMESFNFIDEIAQSRILQRNSKKPDVKMFEQMKDLYYELKKVHNKLDHKSTTAYGNVLF